MKQSFFEISSNFEIARGIFKMTLSGDTEEIKRPGQFVNIRLKGKYLRRPISVCDYKDKELTLIYKVVGSGTKQMSEMVKGEVLDVLTGLGNGFDTEKSGDEPLLIGGGVGVPPLYSLAKKLAAEGKRVNCIIGFNSSDEVFLYDELKKICSSVCVTTADGGLGKKGFVTDAVDDFSYTYVYTCGPEPMLKAVYEKIKTEGQFSFEERMGCGFGACMGCSCKTKYGAKRICREGPVLLKEEIIW